MVSSKPQPWLGKPPAQTALTPRVSDLTRHQLPYCNFHANPNTSGLYLLNNSQRLGWQPASRLLATKFGESFRSDLPKIRVWMLAPSLKPLRQLDPDQLTVDEVRQGFRVLLALCEELLAQQDVLLVRVAALEQRRSQGTGKGGKGGKVGGAASGSQPPDRTAGGGSRSSESERRDAEGRRPWQKSARNGTLGIDQEVSL